MKCFYNSTDLDGQCSAAIILREFPDCVLHPINGSIKIDIHKVKSERIIMMGYSLPMEQMEIFDPKKFIWIDHHRTALKEARERNFLPLGIRSMDTASCELTWEYFNSKTTIPLGVQLISRYETREYKWLNKKIDGIQGVVLFQYGLKSYNTDPTSNIWFKVLTNSNGFIDEMIEAGSHVLRYIDYEYERYAKGYTFEVQFEGMNCICCNRGYIDAKLFEQVYNKKRHSIMIAFARQGRKRRWKVSLYTDDKSINCGEIAKRYGGGGHKMSAGFKCKNLPFTI